MIPTAMKMLITYSLFILINTGFAETQKTIQFENQREESFNLENFLKETRTRKEDVNSTCYRQIPYTENVCHNETRYREQCRTVPGHQDCRTVYDRVCHSETRYENECYNQPGEQICRVVVRYREECSGRGGGGRECRTVPGDVRCHRSPNGEQVCDKIPPHEECNDTPDRRECRQVPYEERECSTGPSRQICRQVPRQQEICDNQSRQQCDWIPDRNVCENIPYEVPVCKDEVLYRQEAYSCMKTIDVPYEVNLKTHKANVQVNFSESSASVTPQMNFSLGTNGILAIKGNDAGENKAVVFVKKVIKNSEQTSVNSIEARYNFVILDRAETFGFIDSGLTNLSLGKTDLSFYVNGKFDTKRASLSVRISKSGNVKFNKVLTSGQFETAFDGKGIKVSVDLGKYGAPKLGGFLSKKHEVSLKLKIDYSDAGEILLPEIGEISAKLDQEIKVD